MAKLYLQRFSTTAIEPVQATEFSACHDIHADLVDREVTVFAADNSKRIVDTLLDSLVLKPGDRALVPTGWKMQPEAGFAVKFYPRSGLSIKQGINLANCVGVIDRDFPDETMLALHNTSGADVMITHGDRVGQLEVYQVEPIEKEVVETLPSIESSREGGFGSTGV